MRKLFVLLEIALVVGLHPAAHFSVAIFVQHVGVVVVIPAAANGQ